ncbi:MAG: daunorubicin resistance protein DrrA family ABC transporter ATP-binding protein [Candidatus Zixiibacteriota bacterium]
MNLSPNPPAVIVTDLVHQYEGRPALKGISFQIEEGEFFGILGPNGGGKSTTFRILATLLTPTSGHATVCGYDVVKSRDAVRYHIGVAFQAPALDTKLTVHENMMHHGHLYGLSGADLRRRIDESLSGIGLRDRSGDLVEKLSGGLRRRIELAKALMSHPSVLILDEPTVGLDPRARDDFWKLVQDLRARTGMTVLATTHLLEEGSACDRIAILDEGRIVALDSPSVLCGQIPGEIVTIHGRGIVDHADLIARTLGVSVETQGDALRLNADDGTQAAGRVRELLGDAIDSISIARPTLSDVFRQRTGHAFASESQLSGVS